MSETRMAVEKVEGQWRRTTLAVVEPPKSFWASELAFLLPHHELLKKCATQKALVLAREEFAMGLLEGRGYLTSEVGVYGRGYGSAQSKVYYAEITEMGRELLSCLDFLTGR